MASTVLILSAQDVAQLTQDLPADAIVRRFRSSHCLCLLMLLVQQCRMIGKTMHAISADSNRPHDPSSATAPPIQNPLRIATESEQHKTLYMPSRLTTTSGVSSFPAAALACASLRVLLILPPSASLAGVGDSDQGKQVRSLGLNEAMAHHLNFQVVAVPKPRCTIPGLPATTLLFDESTGLCRAVINAAELTGLRTA
jgi:hypothetical protein